MNFFGMLGQIGRMLPGYVDGRRMAIADNWQDQSNYNQNLHGQMRNAFDIATFEPQMANVYQNADMTRLAGIQGLGNFRLWEQTFPEQMRNALAIYQRQIAQQSKLYDFLNRIFEGQIPGQNNLPAQNNPPAAKANTADPNQLFNQRLIP